VEARSAMGGLGLEFHRFPSQDSRYSARSQRVACAEGVGARLTGGACRWNAGHDAQDYTDAGPGEFLRLLSFVNDLLVPPSQLPTTLASLTFSLETISNV